MSQNHELPSGTYVPTPVSEVKPGDIVLWYDEPCTVDNVIDDETGHRYIAFSCTMRYETSLADISTIHVWKAGSEV